MKKVVFFIIGVFWFFISPAQDVDYARKALKKLTSKSFHGRGYVKNGDGKAANYIAKQFEKHNVNSFQPGYLQHYTFPINTFPDKITVEIDGQRLAPGKDYVISSSASTTHRSFPLHFVPDSIDNEESLSRYIESKSLTDSALVVRGNFKKLYGKSLSGVQGVVLLSDKTPWWHVSNGANIESTVWIKIKKEYLQKDSKEIYIDFNNEFVQDYKTQNVVGFVKGKKHPDRYVVYTAHYDHLGMMGNKTYFPGANDNGSGTAMLLDLARYYALPENQPDYSIAFMAFSGEEAGLRGSSFYADNPIFPLESIPLLINLDMVGSGSEGITIVNGKAYKGLFDEMTEINDQNSFISEIKARGESCNSDHCPFYKKGVKSIFIYTRGEELKEYHSINDVDNNFPFTAYNGLFKLLTTYVGQMD